MTSSLPPLFQTSIFNSTAFERDTEPLTLDDANDLFLTKSFPIGYGDLTMSNDIKAMNQLRVQNDIGPALTTSSVASQYAINLNHTTASAGFSRATSIAFISSNVDLAPGASLRFERTGSQSGGDLVFGTKNVGAGSCDERLRIKANGESFFTNTVFAYRYFISNTNFGFSHKYTTGGTAEIITFTDGMDGSLVGTFTNHNFSLSTNGQYRLTIAKTSGDASISSTTDATSSTAGGSLTVSGGGAFAKKLFVGTDLNVSGTTTLAKNVTMLKSNMVAYERLGVRIGRDVNLGNNAVIEFQYVGNNSNDNNLIFAFESIPADDTPVMILTKNERLGIGLGVLLPAYQLELGTNSAAKPTSSSWTISSDERIKEEIENADLEVCYDIVKELALKRFKWKDEFMDVHKVSDAHQLGWIAQEVEIMLPKSVHTSKNDRFNIEDFKSLDNDQIIACMYGCIQKLIEKVELLEK